MTASKDDRPAQGHRCVHRCSQFLCVKGVLALFTLNAVIDDPSTGHCFNGHAGIRNYIEQYFIGYHTVTRFISIDRLGDNQALVRVDFTGDFGHEIGLLKMSVNAQGMVVRIDANLE